MTPAFDGGLAATTADDGVAATTTISRLRAAVAERVMATVAGSGVAATTATSRLRAAAVERAMALAFDGGVAAMAGSNSCRWAAAVERVVHVPRSCLVTAEWLSDHDGSVPLAIVGEAHEVRYREGGENARQDSPTVRVFIAGR